jgi:hypothetical protein
MTCIVGITDGKRIVVGSDSAGSSPDNPEIHIADVAKVFATGEYLVGYCGSYRAGQLARWEMEWPEPPEPGANLERFFTRVVIKALRHALRDAEPGFTQELPRTAQFLIGLRGHLFTIGNDFSAVKRKDPWLAIGSGRNAAYGALHVLAGLEFDLEEKVRRALAAAQGITANVREPFQLLSVG